MRKALVMLIASFLGLALFINCGPPSELDPNKIATISGKYLDENGESLANAEIGMWILDFTNIYLNNWWYPAPTYKTWTKEDGTFKFEVMGKEFIWTATGAAKYVIIANTEKLEDPVTAMGFFVIHQEEEQPDAKLWKANVSHTIENDTATFVWNPVDDVAGKSPDRYGFSARLLYWDLWREDTVQSGFSLPTYVFQNVAGAWRVHATIERPDDNSIDWSYHSETYAGTNVLPNEDHELLSKAKSAYINEDTTTNYSNLTNQVFHELENFDNSHPSSVMIDLGITQTVNAVVVYGLATSYPGQTHTFDAFEVYVSDDMANWGTAVATVSREDGYLRFDFDAADGRYVKFQADEGSNIQINWIKEMAAFGPAQ